MKRFIKNVTLFLLIFSVIFCCTGCKFYVKSNILDDDSVKLKKLAEYPKTNAPVKIINTGDYWYSLIGTYGNDNYKLTVSENPEDLNVVYEIKDSSIWCFEANNDYAVWSEIKETENKVMLYENSDNKVTDIYTIDTTEDFHISHIGLYKDYVYYIESDYENNTESIVEYNINSNSTKRIYSIQGLEDNVITNLSVKENYLTITLDNDKIDIVLIDLDSDNKPIITELPENAYYVYDVAYDNINDTYAVYYADKDKKEHIGVYNNKMKEIKNILTFNENCYAYQDCIECYDGHLYWISQANVSGNISDHYQLVDYNYIEDKPKEYKRTFYFSRSSNAMYGLSFDKSGEYENIVLDKYDIKTTDY